MASKANIEAAAKRLIDDDDGSLNWEGAALAGAIVNGYSVPADVPRAKTGIDMYETLESWGLVKITRGPRTISAKATALGREAYKRSREILRKDRHLS